MKGHSHRLGCRYHSCPCYWAPPACWRSQHCFQELCKCPCTPAPSLPPAYSKPPQSEAQTGTQRNEDHVLKEQSRAEHWVCALNKTSPNLVGLCRRTVVQSHSKRDSRRWLLLESFPHQSWDALSPCPFILGRAGVICTHRTTQRIPWIVASNYNMSEKDKLRICSKIQ